MAKAAKSTTVPVQAKDPILSKIDTRMKWAQTKANELTEQKGFKVTFEAFIEKDEKTSKPTGNVYVAFIKPPHVLALVKAMDMYIAQRYFEAGYMLWPVCYMQEESDKEIEQNDQMKAGLMGAIGINLNAHAPAAKKN